MSTSSLPDTFPELRNHLGLINKTGATNLVNEILAKPPHTLFHLVLGSLLENLKIQNEILALDDSPSVAAIAWAGRNIMELFILSRYCCQSARKLTRFHADSLIIQSMMLNGVIQLSSDWAKEHGHKGVPASIHRTHEQAEKFREKAGLKQEQPQLAKTCAKTVGMRKEYEAFGRLTSPLVHPSAVIVLRPFDVESCRISLVMHSLKRASDLILELREHIEKHGCTPATGELVPLAAL
jgi:hypothetical protein